MYSKLARIIVLTLAIAAFVAFAAMAFAEDKPAEGAKKPTYVGSDKCKICHKGEKHATVFEKWSESKHAKAMSVLKADKGEDKDAKCLKCHTTGYGMGGYGEKGMENLDLAAVGCEACHGPGSEYKAAAVMKDKAKAKAAGLIVPDANVCKTCHNSESPTSKGEFKFDEMFPKIKHTVPDSLKSK
jgi:hypothetical protein